MTEHQIILGDSRNMKDIPDESVNLIVTSPPYPMISMWDKYFGYFNPDIVEDLRNAEDTPTFAQEAFFKMHSILEEVWIECNRVLKSGGLMCINIGDAVRTFNGKYQLFPNHAQVIRQIMDLRADYSVLPSIIWHKMSNKPSKFLGSGMLPPTAYVSLDHEYILIFRKGDPRTNYTFKTTEERHLRRESAYFFEERNSWFSDLWDIHGVSQEIKAPDVIRERSGAFPLEIPLRLIYMYSVKDDIILDPFTGLGTTNIACMIAERNSIGVDVNPEVLQLALQNMTQDTDVYNKVIKNRISQHRKVIDHMQQEDAERIKKAKKEQDKQPAQFYGNKNHNFLVKTQQEVDIKISQIDQITQAKKNKNSSIITCTYKLYAKPYVVQQARKDQQADE